MTTMLFGQSKLKHCLEKNWQLKSGTKREAGYAISTIPRYLWLDKLKKRQREEIWLEPWNKGTIPDCIDHILKHDVRAHGFSWVKTGFNVLSIDLGLAEMGDMGAKKLFQEIYLWKVFFQDAGCRCWNIYIYFFYKFCPKPNHQKCTRVGGGIGCSKSWRLSHHEWWVINDDNELHNAYSMRWILSHHEW